MPVEKSTMSEVTIFRRTEVRQTPAYPAIPEGSYEVTYLYGPCLACGRETKYSGRWFRYMPIGEEEAWIKERFQRRDSLLRSLATCRARHRGYPKAATIETLVCVVCREDFRQRREADARSYRQEYESAESWRKRRQAALDHHYAWRTFETVDRTTHGTEFRAVRPNFGLHEIVFRWRAVPGEGRGDSPLNVIGMWVDEKLAARYYSWELANFTDDDEGEEEQIGGGGLREVDDWQGAVEYTCDLWGPGFAAWIPQAFQSELLGMKPSFIWGAEWPSISAWSDSGGYDNKPLDIVQTRWLDGKRYAAFRDASHTTLQQVAEWAETHLGLRIEERRFRPVTGSAARES